MLYNKFNKTIVVLKGGYYMTTYSVNEVFKRLKALKITSNEESVRRWLRTGKLKGYQNSKKQGWRIREEDLQQFIDERLPDFNATNVVLNNTTDEQSVNTTNVVLKEAIREQMWYQIVHRNIFEGFIDIKKSRLKDCIEHKRYSKDFFTYCWDQLSQKNQGRAVPRVPYLLDAFLYDSKRIKMGNNYELLEEKVIFALIEYLRLKKVKK